MANIAGIFNIKHVRQSLHLIFTDVFRSDAVQQDKRDFLLNAILGTLPLSISGCDNYQVINKETMEDSTTSLDINIIPFYGQSNSNGALDFSQTWRTPMPWGIYPPKYEGVQDGSKTVTRISQNQFLTLSASYLKGGGFDGFQLQRCPRPLRGIPCPLDITALKDAAYGFSGEGAVHGMLQSIAKEYPKHKILTFSSGIGGESIVNLDKPTRAEILNLSKDSAEYKILVEKQTIEDVDKYSFFEFKTHYFAFMWQLVRSTMLVRAQGKTPIVRALVWQQGESDSDKLALYPTLFAQLCNDLTKDIKLITKQSSNIAIMCDSINYSTTLEQPGQLGYEAYAESEYSNSTKYLTESERVNDSFGWDLQHDANIHTLRKAQPHLHVYMVAPRYPVNSSIHMHPHAARAHGEHFGKVYKKVVLEGADWEPVRPLNWWFDTTSIFVRFNVPNGPLQFAIPPQGSTHTLKATMPYGLEHSAGAIARSQVVLVASDLICITPTVAPATGQQLHYCKSVRYGSLCDSDPTPNTYTDRADAANVLRNYCLPFSIAL